MHYEPGSMVPMYGEKVNIISELCIVITSRSPLKNYWQDPRVDFVAIDFLAPLDEIIRTMTGVLKERNTPLFDNFLTAIDTVAGPALQRVCLQTVDVLPVEEMPGYDDNGLNFYYLQEDFIFMLHAQRNWSWNVIRPNSIVGFTPAKNGMSEAVTLALYMLICKELGEVPRFPGSKYFYEAVDGAHKNEAFNHANGDTLCALILTYIPKQTEWPELGENKAMTYSFRMGEWAKNKRAVWEKVCEKHGGDKEAFNWAVGKAWLTISSINKAC
ncbi:hypothetical protein BDW59DRAFT_169906 [Aspergillus cavernicola]|uniref:PRISE-like Rossmann-fold domain-containing protein n=1 Tax=Aspergillus cavernicola TaxID=176166 RepID=A0ABR4ITV8_9EURO